LSFDSFPVVTDPWFYAAAIPAVLLIGLAKSGFGIGFGALAVPLLGMVVPIPQAAAILLPVLAIADIAGLQQLWRDRDAKLLRHLLPWGLLGTLIGALLFGALPLKVVTGVVGALTLAFLAQRLLFPPKRDDPPPPRWLGPVLTTASGFTSFVAHAGSPPISAYLLPQKLPPRLFSATMAVYFTVLNTAKWVPYAWLGLIDLRNLATSLLLMPLAPAGVWLGVRLTRYVNPTWFYRFAYAGMALTGAKLLWDGLR
jgi:uncharacterized protein